MQDFVHRHQFSCFLAHLLKFFPCPFQKCNLSDSKSLQVSRTLLSILVNLNNIIVCIVPVRSQISNSFSPFFKSCGRSQARPITIGITVTLMFYIFLSSLARFLYLSFFSLSLIYIQWSAGTAKSIIWQTLFFLGFFFCFVLFCFVFNITRASFLAGIRWSVCISKSQKILCVSFSRMDYGLCSYYYYYYYYTKRLASFSLQL